MQIQNVEKYQRLIQVGFGWGHSNAPECTKPHSGTITSRRRGSSDARIPRCIMFGWILMPVCHAAK
eukprot:5524689-Prorocentrum_lima.AAC.1